ncbi:tellurium resistance protein TerA [Rhodoblastus acidophilus]|uniref:Tellurium resistance protein TerA n=1 Tax=Rhodoblastus acidophilus TaxID=1074 RepID=A0A6N8DPW1_RHOAC|nr:TerD family protein [Rhodoblastus acidophilus]MCW2274839.1 tellurite resistance protein TerA [Rhodoblastus acidophilus]MTV31575.1 tellurium resistance protein TerA [Rhodoblastus acidophilus]
MPNLQKGENAPLPTTTPIVRIQIGRGSIVGDIDISAYLLGETGKVSGDPDMVFYGQRQSGDGAVRLTSSNDSETVFSLNLASAAARVQRIAFAATLPGEGVARPTFANAASVAFEIEGADPIRFPVPTEGAIETSMILGEIYRRNGVWKVRAVGQGFSGGLKPLAESFGVVVAEDPAPTPAPPPPPPPSAVSLSKVTLTKAQPKIDLTKKGDSFGEIRINLNWSAAPVKTGFFGRPRSVDLDLGCLYELRDGHRGGIQALGDSFGAFNFEPYIELSGDDRSGAVAEGEWLRINGARWGEIRRLLIYAFIYEGAPNWAATDGRITLYTPGAAPVEVPLEEGDSRKNMCAVALIENVDGQMRVSREVRYFNGHAEMDRSFHWGLRWVAGAKD